MDDHVSMQSESEYVNSGFEDDDKSIVVIEYLGTKAYVPPNPICLNQIGL